MPNTVNFGEVKKSTRDLTRIYKPRISEVNRFVSDFVRKYNLSRGYERELSEIVLQEINEMNNQ